MSLTDAECPYVRSLCALSDDVLLLACDDAGLRAVSLSSAQLSAHEPTIIRKVYGVAYDKHTDTLLLIVWAPLAKTKKRVLAGVSPPQRERVARSESSFDRAYLCTSHFSVRLTRAALRSGNAKSVRVLRDCRALGHRRGLCECRKSVHVARVRSPWQRHARCIRTLVISVIAPAHVTDVSSISTYEAHGSLAQLSLEAFVHRRPAACRLLEEELCRELHRVIPRVGQRSESSD